MFELAVAATADFERIEGLVRAYALPVAGLREQFPDAYVVGRHDREVVAAAGLELHGDAALLRSLAVDPRHRRHGLGAALVANRLNRARELGVSVYLLTTTAADYFPRFGFAPAARRAVPPRLAASVEFAGVCPDSAACLVWHPDSPASFSLGSRLDRQEA